MGRRGARPALRLFALLGVLTLSLVTVAGRLVQLQVVKAAAFEDLGARQRVRRLELPATRGRILDRNGAPLAMSVSARAIYANPAFVTDPDQTAAQIGPLLGLDPALILERLHKDAPFVYLARKVDLPAADRVMALRLPGIGALEESKRVYPAGSVAGQVLGFVGTDNIGLAGLEAGWNKLLAGVAGEEIVEQDPHGRPIPQGKSHFRAPVQGEDLVLTIDRDIQFATEQALVRALQSTGASDGSAIVIDPRTGEILAMANAPVLDPTAFGQATPDQIRNRAILDAYEPGSVNKVVTAAAAIEAGITTPSEMLEIPDSFRIADKTFRDFHPHAPWRITYADALARSSNIGTILVAQRVGKQRLYDRLRAFGLGQKTGVEFPGESTGILADPKEWYGTSMGTIPIGQGIALTPIQVAHMYAAIANDGLAVAPHLVLGTINVDGKRKPRPEPATKRAITPFTSAQLRAMLIGVVEEGTGKNADVPGYIVAGKTGTARKPLPEARGYSTDVVTTFAGMVPADAPRFVLTVVLNSPATHLSATTAAPAFKEIARFVVARLGIPPNVAAPIARAATG